MMSKTILFSKTGYDPFIDFIKAYAIICVLLGHTFPVAYMGYGLWAGMQVPLFILVQTFHFYKRDVAILNIKKLFQRIVLPFMIVGAFEFLLFFIFGDKSVKSLIITLLKNGGGDGPGSYFPLIYIQIALILLCFKWVFRRYNRKQLLWIFIILSEVLEIACSFIQPPGWLYRLLAVRYIFLIYFGWLWVQEGIVLNRKMVVLSVISAVTIIYFEYVAVYFYIDNEPWFFNTKWTFHRWPCYYFCANGLVGLLYVFWNKLKNSDRVYLCVQNLAKSSYEIFLVQMCVCLIIGQINVPPVLMISFIWIISIFGGIVLNKLINNTLITRR